MVKAHLSLLSFLIGFLLVLFVADIGYVRGECDVGRRMRVEDGCYGVDCDSLCISSCDFLVSHTECQFDEGYIFSGHYCACCR
ncbi:hypothetical protein MKW98_013495 [Papaver atlanticum]|uniref:Knottin scorpion toxin-like domain-containing protein n=2 Tax=Papaver TaxID=3468 RepID=A0A4Y7ILK5_PAPSO|nr:hypothetical protein MKW98_013495 [Papaver atlanticum]RZC48349.1 hypothetical protein C5167_041288 [Papaver somniferum]